MDPRYKTAGEIIAASAQEEEYNRFVAGRAPARVDVRSINGVCEALRALMKLIEDGDLVRDISHDHDTMLFVKQGMRITSALKNAQDALASHTALRSETKARP